MRLTLLFLTVIYSIALLQAQDAPAADAPAAPPADAAAAAAPAAGAAPSGGAGGGAGGAPGAGGGKNSTRVLVEINLDATTPKSPLEIEVDAAIQELLKKHCNSMFADCWVVMKRLKVFLKEEIRSKICMRRITHVFMCANNTDENAGKQEGEERIKKAHDEAQELLRKAAEALWKKKMIAYKERARQKAIERGEIPPDDGLRHSSKSKNRTEETIMNEDGEDMAEDAENGENPNPEDVDPEFEPGHGAVKPGNGPNPVNDFSDDK